MGPMTYRKSGVDIDLANRFVDSIKRIAGQSHNALVLKGIGSFGAFFRLPKGKYRNPILVSSADGVGTKLKCAMLAGKFEGLGIDLVGMNVNDILTSGARPLFFLDYIAVGRIRLEVMREIVTGIVQGCKLSSCALIGGETAEMPGVYRKDDFDLAGFAVGVVEEAKIIAGHGIRENDAVVGLASSGFQSNGFSLVRKALSRSFIIQHADEILKPTRIYVPQILELIKRVDVLGMAHITGGSFYDKVPRIIPHRLGVLIHAGSWKVPEVFKWVQQKGGVSPKEMHRTFNMGIGFVVVVRQKDVLKTLNLLSKAGVESWVIGKVIRGKGVTLQ